MGVFGLTMAVPFVILSMVPRRLAAMPQAGEWMNMLKVFLGFVELAAALKFLSNADLVWGWGFLSRELFLVLWMAHLPGRGALPVRLDPPRGREPGRDRPAAPDGGHGDPALRALLRLRLWPTTSTGS